MNTSDGMQFCGEGHMPPNIVHCRYVIGAPNPKPYTLTLNPKP